MYVGIGKVGLHLFPPYTFEWEVTITVMVKEVEFECNVNVVGTR